MRHLDAKNNGEFDYDYKNDLLVFKTKERDYEKSIEFDDLVADIDKEGFISGIRIFDASKVFKLPKSALQNLHDFEFNSRVEDKIVNIRLRFSVHMRNKDILRQSQDFIREITGSHITDSETLSTAVI